MELVSDAVPVSAFRSPEMRYVSFLNVRSRQSKPVVCLATLFQTGWRPSRRSRRRTRRTKAVPATPTDPADHLANGIRGFGECRIYCCARHDAVTLTIARVQAADVDMGAESVHVDIPVVIPSGVRKRPPTNHGAIGAARDRRAGDIGNSDRSARPFLNHARLGGTGRLRFDRHRERRSACQARGEFKFHRTGCGSGIECGPGRAVQAQAKSRARQPGNGAAHGVHRAGRSRHAAAGEQERCDRHQLPAKFQRTHQSFPEQRRIANSELHLDTTASFSSLGELYFGHEGVVNKFRMGR